jgi:release factor glutamine methyltransferase
LQAELLLAHVLNLPRMKLYLNFERALKDSETDTFRELVKRRAQREPLQHIVGSTSFCGLEISVNRHVLVPRPETELLAEMGWSFLSGISSQPATALDFGTGSGCIAIALAAKVPGAVITALDVSNEALQVARQNAAKNNVADRVVFVQGDVVKSLAQQKSDSREGDEPHGQDARATTAFDLIVSNPPYIPTAEIATLDPEVRDYDPREALDGGADGLDFYRRLAKEARPFLRPGGKIMVEFGEGQGAAIRDIINGENWIVEGLREDYTQRERILIAR